MNSAAATAIAKDALNGTLEGFDRGLLTIAIADAEARVLTTAEVTQVEQMLSQPAHDSAEVALRGRLAAAYAIKLNG